MTNETSRRAFLKKAGAAATIAGGSALGQRREAQQTESGQQPGAPASPPATAPITSSLMIWTLKGSFEEKVSKAAQTGVQSLELVSEHVGWSDVDVKKYKALVKSYGLGMDTVLGQQNWTKRPVTMVNPEHREGFLKDVKDAIQWAKKLDIQQVIVLSGNEQPGMSHEQQYGSMVEGAKRATELATEANVTLILENLNSKVNHKGYFLTSAKEALQAIKEVDSPHFRMLFDIYHEYVQHGDPIATINEAEPYVNVFHVADAPGRHDPGTGQMKWDDIYRAIAKTDYKGYITMEYLPEGDEVQSLKKALTQMRRETKPPARS